MTKTWMSQGGWGVTIHIGNSYPPVYQQVVEQMTFHIAQGHMKPGDKLPTVRELAEALGINFNTVAKAYHELAGQGLVLGRKGGGSSVVEKVPELQASSEKKIEQLYQRLVTEAASYGVGQHELQQFLRKKEGRV